MTRHTIVILRRCVLPSLLLVAGCGSDGEPATVGEASDAEYAEAMAREHADDDDRPSPAAEEPAGGAITTSEVSYGTVGEATLEGYLAVPQGVENPPGVVVIHEWWGLNDNIRKMAERLAGEGYAALAVDLYGGRVASEPDDARAIMQSATESEADVRANLRAAHDYLVSELEAERTGVIGWCFGGGWALQSSLMIPDLDAAVVYYGRVETSSEALESLEVPLLGHFGAGDQGIPLESVRQFEEALGELGKEAAIHVYDGAGHAFANPSGSRYEATAAETAWDRTTAFFAEHLKESLAAPDGETGTD